MNLRARIKKIEEKKAINRPEVLLIDDISDNKEEWEILHIPSGKVEPYKNEE